MSSIFAPTQKHQVHTYPILPSYFALPSTQFHHLFGIMKELVFVFKTHVPSPLDVDPNQWCIWLYHGCTAAVLIGHSRVPTGNHKVGPQIKLILLFTIYNSIAISMTTKRQKDRKTEKTERQRDRGLRRLPGKFQWTNMNWDEQLNIN